MTTEDIVLEIQAQEASLKEQLGEVPPQKKTRMKRKNRAPSPLSITPSLEQKRQDFFLKREDLLFLPDGWY